MPFLLFPEPPSFDPRIADQFALFSVMSRADASLADWLEPHEGTAREIVIPAAAKQESRDKPDRAGIAAHDFSGRGWPLRGGCSGTTAH